MKKLIALFAATTMASSAAVAGVALSGSASVSYDDNGTAASSTTYDADLTATGTAGGTTFTYTADLEGSAGPATTGADLSTTIGPVTIAADMHDEVSAATSSTVSGGQRTETTDTGVTISLDVPIGDMTIGLDNSGNVILSGTFSGVTVSHTVGDTTTTTASAAIAGIDMSVTNKAGSTTWTIGTTVAGTAVTVGSDKSVSATFGVTGNTVVVKHVAERASATSTTSTKYSTAQKDAYTTIAVSRDLTSGAALAATYNTFDSSLTLKASVAF